MVGAPRAGQRQVCALVEAAGLSILDKHATERARRILVGMDVVDTSSIIIASPG